MCSSQPPAQAPCHLSSQEGLYPTPRLYQGMMTPAPLFLTSSVCSCPLEPPSTGMSHRYLKPSKIRIELLRGIIWPLPTSLASHSLPVAVRCSNTGLWWPCVRTQSRFCRVRLFGTLWTETHQAPLSMGFSRQEYWTGLPCPPPGDLSDPGIEPVSLTST